MCNAHERAPMVRASIIDTQNGPVECASFGDGPAIIALHGGMGGHDQSQLLARAAITHPGYRILAISRPGYLGTPLKSGQSPEEQADLCAALLDALGIARAAVIAVSAGGLCALQFAVRHADRCWGLVTVSACTGQLETPLEVLKRLQTMGLMSCIPGVTALLRRRTRSNPLASARRSIADDELCRRTLAHPEAGPLMTALQSSLFVALRRRVPGVVCDITYEQHRRAYPWERISAPVLAIHGTGDRIVPFAHGVAVATAVPGAAFMAIEGGEHVCLFTHLDAVRERVGGFLAGHASCH